jgi:uncharacterized ferritin-like protein (DUF455 family)
MRDRNAYFGACGGLLRIGILFILINCTRNHVNINNRYFRDFLFSNDTFAVFARLFRKNHQTFSKSFGKYSAGYTSRHQSLSRCFGVSDAPKCKPEN